MTFRELVHGSDVQYLDASVIDRILRERDAEAFTERQGYGSIVRGPAQIKAEDQAIVQRRTEKAKAMHLGG